MFLRGLGRAPGALPQLDARVRARLSRQKLQFSGRAERRAGLSVAAAGQRRRSRSSRPHRCTSQVHGRSSSCSSSWAALQGTSASDFQRLAAVEAVSGQERSGRAAKPVLSADGCGSGADFGRVVHIAVVADVGMQSDRWGSRASMRSLPLRVVPGVV